MSSTSDLRDRIVKHVRKHWKQQSAPLFLSSLGKLEDGDISRQIREEFEGVRSFLQEDECLQDQLRVVTHSNFPAMVGVVPRDRKTDAIKDWDSMLEKSRPSSVVPRLHPAFWAAFRKPLTKDMERFLKISDESIRFEDTSSDSHATDGIRISPELLAEPHATDEEVYGNAEKWAQANGFNIIRFRLSPKPHESQEFPAKDLLSKIISTLDAEDLRKISMPLDVIAKLRRSS